MLSVRSVACFHSRIVHSRVFSAPTGTTRNTAHLDGRKLTLTKLQVAMQLAKKYAYEQQTTDRIAFATAVVFQYL